MRWSEILREYFSFNARERRGTYVLLILIFFFASVYLWVRLSPPSPNALSPAAKAKFLTIDSMLNIPNGSLNTDIRDTLFTFDPNKASLADFRSLGLEAKLAQRIINYREKGGRFKTDSALFKIYGIDSSWCSRVLPFVVIPQDAEESSHQRAIEANTHGQQSLIELNSADTAALMSIRGIGPVLSQRIVEYRTQLGGFTDIGQLLEVYGLKEDVFEQMLHKITLDVSTTTPLNLNTADQLTLARHPYLQWKQAKAILNYKTQHGPYQKVEDVLKTKVINDSLYHKLAPYLTVE